MINYLGLKNNKNVTLNEQETPIVDYIIKITKDFTSESLRNQDPAGLCFSTSIYLQIYLATKQIKSNLISGKVPSHDVTHFWLYIESEDIIVDATIQQFNNPEPIYVGKLKDNEITKTYIPNGMELDKWFQTHFNIWENPFVITTFPLNGEYDKRNILYTIKLATILHAEIKQLIFIDEFVKKLFGIYFNPIYNFLYHWHTKTIDFEIKREIMPIGFDNLLEEVLQWGKDNSER